MTYALGRGMEYYDEPAVRAVIRDASGEKTTSTNPALENPTIPAIIHAIVNNPQFQTRRTPDL